MKPPYGSQVILAAVAAFVVLAAAWFFPLRPIIAGEEAYAPQIVPQTRTSVMSSEQAFEAARNRYQAYIKSHDLSALLISARTAITQARSTPDDLERLIVVRDAAREVDGYARELQLYAAASDGFLATLQHYDDDLMSWTRSLGAASEVLRPDTFPFVEHLKKYPPPVGQTADPPMVNAQEVVTQISALEEDVAALNPAPNPHTGQNDTATRLDRVDRDVTGIWASGRSVEYVAGLHEDYLAMLRTYDTKVEARSKDSGGAGPQGGRLVLANALTLLLGLVIAGGFFGLFMNSDKQ